MLRTIQVSTITTTLLAWSAVAFAQTTPGTPAAPGAGTATATDTAADGTNWLWIIIVLALIAAAAWYFMRGRRSGPNL
jgi:hypothetical protein